MGSFDGAEICELVGLHILNKLSQIIPAKDLGLYRDDGIAVIENASGPKMDNLRKKVIALFKSFDLSITAETNLHQTDFLDVTFNLQTGKFFPYRKPNNQPQYVNIRSNHPPSIKKQIPKMINTRIANLSCDQSSFDHAAPDYVEALSNSGYHAKFNYESKNTPGTHNKSTKRRRKILWFNPPYNEEVKTNVGKVFFSLMDKHFPPHHKLFKICNKLNVKLSYSCMPNMASIINKHNRKILNNNDNFKPPPCNCRNPTNCPLNRECRMKSIIYKATLTTPSNPPQYYIGCCETEFKKRYYNHCVSFNNRNKSNATELSKSVWKFKDQGIDPIITWSIIRKAPPFQCGAKRCNLCLYEKLSILLSDPNSLLNKRSELISKCRHKNKYKLRYFK